MTRVRLPRWLILLASTAIITLPAMVAFGYQYIKDNHNPARVVHLHTGAYDVYNAINQNASMKAQADDAIDDWHAKLAARNTVQMNHISSGTGAEIKLHDAPTDSGAAVVYQESFHQGTAVDVTFRAGQQGEDSWSADQKQHKACNVLGNVIGLDDTTGSGDCMQGGIDAPTIAGAGADKVDDFYGPTPSIDGPLASRKDNLLTTGSYDVSGSANGHGIQSVTTRLDGDVIATQSRTPCDETCSVMASPASPVDGLSAGTHTLSTTARNEFGQTTTKTITLTVGYPTPAWGFMEGWQQTNPDNLDEIAKTGLGSQTSLGATTNRIIVKWSDVEQTPGIYSWGNYGAAYNAMIDAGQRPVIDLSGAPDWASGQADGACGSFDDCQHPPTSAHYDDWQEFVRRAVLQFPRARAYEIWNEPNFDRYWYPTRNAGQYVNVLHRANDGVDAAFADPGFPSGVAHAPVITGGLAPGSGSRTPQHDYLVTLYEDGASPYFDGIGEHVYVGGSTLADWAPHEGDQIDELRGPRDNHGDGDTPIWVTEVGVSTATGYSDPDKVVTAGNQGPTLKAMYDKVGGDVKSFIIFRYHDTAGADDDANNSDLYGRMGVARKDYSHKPAYSYLGCELGGRNCQN